jgi:hypothetical protein
MSEQNIQNKPIPELPPISPDDIDRIIESGEIENLTHKFDKLLEETVAHPNIPMFADTKSEDQIALLNEEARKATEKAKAEVKKVLEEPEEEVPTVTMTDTEFQQILDRGLTNITLDERKRLLKNVKEQLSEVTDELKKILEEEKSLTREKYNLQQEMSKAKKIIDRTKIQTQLSKLQGNLVTISRRKKNVQTMKDKYNTELRNLQ